MNYRTVWRFYNIEENPKTLIQKIVVWQDLTGDISLVEIFFDTLYCKQMEEVFSNDRKVYFFHDHQHQYCKIKFTYSKDIQNLLHWIDKDHQFVDNLQIEMKKILSKL